MKIFQPIATKVRSIFVSHFGWLTNIQHTSSPLECMQEQKLKEIDEKLRIANEKIDNIVATFNGDTNWFIHINREEGVKKS